MDFQLASLTGGFRLLALLQELSEPATIRICSDSSAALSITQRRGVGRIRHLDIRRLFLQDMFREGTLKTSFVKGQENIADLFTKALPAKRFAELSCQLGLTAETDEVNCVSMIALPSLFPVWFSFASSVLSSASSLLSGVSSAIDFAKVF